MRQQTYSDGRGGYFYQVRDGLLGHVMHMHEFGRTVVAYLQETLSQKPAVNSLPSKADLYGREAAIAVSQSISLMELSEAEPFDCQRMIQRMWDQENYARASFMNHRSELAAILGLEREELLQRQEKAQHRFPHIDAMLTMYNGRCECWFTH